MISTVTTTTTTVTIAQTITYSIIAISVLIAFLAAKEILTNETSKNKYAKLFVEGSNIAIVPLLMVFVSLVAYKVVTVI